MQVALDELAGLFLMNQGLCIQLNTDSSPGRLFVDDVVRGWVGFSFFLMGLTWITNLNLGRYLEAWARITHPIRDPPQVVVVVGGAMRSIFLMAI